MDGLIFSLVVLATLIGTNVIAGFRARGLTARVYAGDPDQYRWPTVSLSLLGTIVGGGMFLAVGQMGFEAGVIGWWIGIAYLIGMGLAALLAGRLRRTMEAGGYVTVADALQSVYSRRMALQFSAVNTVMYLFLLSGQFVALYLFVNYFQNLLAVAWLPWALVGAGILSMGLYTVVGGLRKDMLADTVQMVIIIAAAAVLISLLTEAGRIERLRTALPEGHYSGLGYGTLFLVGTLIFIPPSFLVRPDIWQRVRASRSIADVRTAFLITGVGALLFYALFTTVGMWARAEGTGQAKTAVFDILTVHVHNPIALGLVIGGLFAAVLSSADTYINNGSIFLAHLTHSRDWTAANAGDRGPDERVLKAERRYSLLLVIAGASIAYVVPNLVNLMVGAMSLILIYLVPAFAMMFPKLADERAAFYSTSAGLAGFLVLYVLWDPKLAFAPPVVVTAILYFLIRFFAERPLAIPETAQPTASP